MSKPSTLVLWSLASIIVISPLHCSRVFLKQLSKGWSQILKSWVSKSEICRCPNTQCIRIPLFLVATNSLILPASSLYQYIFVFQVPWLPEFALGLRDYDAIRATFTGRQAVRGPQTNSKYFILLVLSHTYTHTHTHTHTLPSSPPTHAQGVKNKASFPPDVVEAYKYVFSQSGALTPPINYYRNMLSTKQSARETVKKTIEVPTLIIWVGVGRQTHLVYPSLVLLVGVALNETIGVSLHAQSFR